MGLSSLVIAGIQLVSKSIFVRKVSAWVEPWMKVSGERLSDIFTIFSTWRIGQYRRDLVEEMAPMPFIYRELDGKILEDFIEPQFTGLEITTLKDLDRGGAANVKGDERLRRKKRVLFIGEAGIGKTTYQRRTIFLLLTNRERVTFLRPDEVPLPIYIPLKAVDNSARYPIIRYILSKHKLFAHKNGQKLFQKLALRRDLFLFIDGYDEIANSSAEGNFVCEELSSIIYPKEFLGHPLHNALANCRIWISTRKDFFQENRFANIGENLGLGWRGLHEADVTVIAMSGITDRQEFTRILFEKYRKENALCKELLDEEFFLTHIDLSGDQEIATLSNNPLFLSVMIYVYVHSVFESRTSKALWLANKHELIDRCVDLLLEELDLLKAGNETEGRKSAILARRNRYKDEKKAFLQSFAYDLFLEGRSLFDFDFLVKKAVEFANHYETPNRQQIIDSLQSGRKRNSSFALDLISCEALRRASKDGAKISYDFPHRLFREVLAAQHIDSAELYCNVLRHLKEKALLGLVAAFKALPFFRDSGMQREAFRYLLGDCIDAPTPDAVEVIDLFLEQKPHEIELNHEVQTFLLECVSVPHRNVMTSLKVLKMAKLEPAFIDRLRDEFRECMETNDGGKLSLICSILKECEPTFLSELIRSDLLGMSIPNYVWAVLVQNAVRSSPKLTQEIFAVAEGNEKSLAILGRVLGRYAYSSELIGDITDDAREYYRKGKKDAIFLYCLSRNHPESRNLKKSDGDGTIGVDDSVRNRMLCVATTDTLTALNHFLDSFSGKSVFIAIESKNSEQERVKLNEPYIYIDVNQNSRLRTLLVTALKDMKYQLCSLLEFKNKLGITVGRAIDAAAGWAHGTEAPAGVIAEPQKRAAFESKLVNCLCEASMLNVPSLQKLDTICQEVAAIPLQEHFV